MAAFERAVEVGAHWIELDVRTCASGEVVVVHDVDMRRVGGRDARVVDLSLDELQRIDVGSWFHPRFAGERVPTLEHVLDTYGGQIRFNIEIKEEWPWGDGTATRTGKLLARMGLDGDVIVSSFNPFALLRARREHEVPVGLLYPPDPEYRLQYALLKRPWGVPLASAYALHPDDSVVTHDLIRKAHLQGLAVNVWTVNDEQRLRKLIAWKVNGLITDDPALALRVVDEMNPLRRPE